MSEVPQRRLSAATVESGAVIRVRVMVFVGLVKVISTLFVVVALAKVR